jgi:hypothetical protein
VPTTPPSATSLDEEFLQTVGVIERLPEWRQMTQELIAEQPAA